MGDSLKNILALLVAHKNITELAPPSELKGWRYDPSKSCAYHLGSPTDNMQDCWSIKHKIKNLIESGDIVVKQPELQCHY